MTEKDETGINLMEKFDDVEDTEGPVLEPNARQKSKQHNHNSNNANNDNDNNNNML